jgi:hypothetical protein
MSLRRGKGKSKERVLCFAYLKPTHSAFSLLFTYTLFGAMLARI